MRKIVIFLGIFVFINGCNQEEELSIYSTDDILKELKSIAITDVDYSSELTPFYDNNPYDEWGETFYKGFTEAIHKRQEMLKSDCPIPDDFRVILNSTIQKEFTIIDTTGVNLENVNAIIGEFISMYANRNKFENIQVSLLMEDYINKSDLIPEIDKTFLLKITSVMRYGSFYMISNQTRNKSAFEDCWFGKLQAMEDSGPFTQLACIASWPVCFGAMLADCAIE